MKSITLFAIRDSVLESLPAAVQLFVTHYFEREMILGIGCYTATSSDDPGSEADFSSSGDTFLKNGSRCQSAYAETAGYKDGLDLVEYPDGAVSWIHKEAEVRDDIYDKVIFVFDE